MASFNTMCPHFFSPWPLYKVSSSVTMSWLTLGASDSRRAEQAATLNQQFAPGQTGLVEHDQGRWYLHWLDQSSACCFKPCQRMEGTLDKSLSMPCNMVLPTRLTVGPSLVLEGCLHGCITKLTSHPERHTEAQCCQMFNQTNLSIYSKSHITNCSSIDGTAAFFNKLAKSFCIKYLQGIS